MLPRGISPTRSEIRNRPYDITDSEFRQSSNFEICLPRSPSVSQRPPPEFLHSSLSRLHVSGLFLEPKAWGEWLTIDRGGG
ncbi:MAG: hypothetical protein D6812_11015 [Deltaproteobacteria bacterium]|nr:MAG: hypothetical protein D6812_11015 [Deltaproteobacteria bacterium]